MGDCNLEQKGSMRVSLLDASSLSRLIPPLSLPRPFENKWNKLFDMMVELDFPFPSHVNSSTLMLSRINRIFLGLPKSSLPLVKICSGVKKDPTWFEGCGLSDHAPVFFKVDTSMKKPPTQLRIHPEWCQHESFHRRLLALNNCISWDTYSLDEQSVMLKEN